MDLSVIIVNYNVKDFLEQCLLSVKQACKNLDVEVFVVDNNSVDASCQMIKQDFSWVHLIENKENTGFAVANNQAIAEAKGRYILLLNPDTLVEEDTFEKVVQFMDKTPDAGGLGVKMIDGNGHFLPESKRALPTPQVAFYKIFGLSRLFPKSKRFGQYHLTYLDKNQTNEVEILSGAFMLLRKSLIDKIGGLDETFFMYGEDIDLSYRVILAGYKNYYFADTTIIHYKGESTKKGSLNYVKTFYNAMIIFAKKHFGETAKHLIAFIQLAIYLRAALSIVKRFLLDISIPLLDLLLLFGGYTGLAHLWESYRYWDGYLPQDITYTSFWGIASLFVFSIYLLGAYYKPVRFRKLVNSIVLASVLVLTIYSLLDESVRFSRLVVISALFWSWLILPVYRYILHKNNWLGFKYRIKSKKKYLIIGGEQEYERVSKILTDNLKTPIIVGFVDNKNESEKALGDISTLNEILRIHKINEVIFSSKDISSQEIISYMSDLRDSQCDFKIVSPDSITVVGSKALSLTNELYHIQLDFVNSKENTRNKRWLDVVLSCLFLILSPVIILFQKQKQHFLSNIFSVLKGKKTWVSYNTIQNTDKLPTIKEGVLSTFNNTNYAKNYSVLKDLNIIINHLRYLGE